MADIPTIAELQTQIENDIKTELEITKTWVGKVMLKVLALVQAAKLKLFYLMVAEVQKNIFVDMADSEQNGGTLERFGRIKLLRNINPATAGEYTLNVTGSIGGIILKGTTFKSNSTAESQGYIFEVKTTVTLIATTGQVEIIALTPGTDALLQEDDELNATAPIANVNSLAIVDSVDVTPVAAETLEEYRQKIIDSYQLEPQGGAATDYRIWSADADGVRTVYPYAKNNQIYTVQVYVEAVPASSAPGQPDGVAPQSMLDEVEDVIELDPDTSKSINERGRRPVQAVVEVLSIIPIGVTFTINDLSDKTTATINAITEALEYLLYTIRPYIAGADTVRRDTLYLSQVIAAIYASVSQSVNFSNVEISIGGTVYSQYTFSNIPATYGNYPYLLDLLTP
ncbi:MAG: baseplate J/gp47 family protein [Atribacterota bacterium]|nr:baseplate J/gp47 family protein [Atribacterota bacterium]